ncbi:metal ABC transporter permease [Candidatus Latescibacterota bacterium]
MIEALQYEFMQHAVIAGILISIACGVIGSLIVVNRMVFISGGIAHAAYGGIGLALFLGISPLLGAGLFSVIIAVVIGILTFRKRERSDTIIGALWSAGMAFGIILVDLTPGYNVDLMSYLFGSILTVPYFELLLMFALNCVIITVISWYYRDFVALSYDDEFASLQGVPVKALYFTLLILSSLTIVMTIRLVGLILVMALLTIPTYIAESFSQSLGGMMVRSSIIGVVFTVSGLWISYTFNVSSGAAIIMLATIVFIIFFTFSRIRERMWRSVGSRASR